MEGPVSKKKVRRVVLGEGYLRMLEFSSKHPTMDGYWHVGYITRLLPSEGKVRIRRMRIIAEIL
jgi:hypothetical protein